MTWKFHSEVPRFVSATITLFFGLFAMISLYNFIVYYHLVFLFKCLYSSLFVFVLLLNRPPVVQDRNIMSVLVVSTHIACPLFFDFGANAGILPLRLSALIVVAGMTISALAVVDLWDAFGLLPARRDIKKNGLYKFVRHPIYLGYMICALACILQHSVIKNVIVFISFSVLTVIRIQNEERLLGLDNSYRQYQKKVRFHLVPGIY